MKKRMFITTIVMMLVLAVALTTSSLAWFSSANTTVQTNTVTFKASATGNNALNLKVSRTIAPWGNTLDLVSGAEAGSMQALIPTTALATAAAKGADFTATGYKYSDELESARHSITYPGYVWPSKLSFNGAKIGDEGAFIIDTTNPVYTATSARMASTGYYFDNFFIHNSGQSADNTINTLRFEVESGLTAGEGDYTCNAYAAFILYDQVKLTSGTVPANAVKTDGSGNIDYTVAGKTIVAELSGTEEEQAQQVVAPEGGLLVWIPFAGFTIAVDNSGNNAETAWQFSDLTGKNGVAVTSLPTQDYDGISGTGTDKGFTLNTASLKVLNNKVANAADHGGSYEAGTGVTGAYSRSVDSSNDPDDSSVFAMKADETYLVSLYFWLDGYTMNNFTDTTVATLKVNIVAVN